MDSIFEIGPDLSWGVARNDFQKVPSKLCCFIIQWFCRF